MTITQKISEKLYTGNDSLGIFFDISKAFDRVWHKGLIGKMLKMKIPLHIIRVITKFLEKREFFVKINEEGSEKFSIGCRLQQGNVLAPTLFAIFINDIPLALEKSKSYSVLFADDLGELYIRTNTWKALENKITVYLNKLTEWLYKWRLKINTSKCNYIVFTKGKS